MKKIQMFMFDGCPHCKRALEIMDVLFAGHPEYREIPFEMTDERQKPDYADGFDYYYVPTFFVGGEKLHEGMPNEAAIAAVFASAME